MSSNNFPNQSAAAAPSEDDTLERKKALRKEIRSKLSQLSPEVLQKESQMVWDRLFQLEAYKEAHSIGVFLSMPKGEILTDALLMDASQRKKHIYVPQVGKNFEQSEMELIRVDTTEKILTTLQPTLFHNSWPRNKWGIPEPPPDSLLQAANPGDLDLLIVPGLAFDQSGNRLGQGKGYYDRFIARMLTPNENVKHPRLVAVGLQCQLLNEDMTIPTNEYDWPMDMVLLPLQTIIRK
jgi:5-formyltetrahydrofolate cyclo-ligase